MHVARDEVPANTLSFVDVVSCALGASIVLFLVYAARLGGSAPELDASVRSGATMRGDRRRGTPADEDGTVDALAVRGVLVSGGIGGSAVTWELPNGCEALVEQRPETTLLLALCPGGLRAGDVVRLQVDVPANILELTSIDGGLPKVECEDSAMLHPRQYLSLTGGRHPSFRIDPEGIELCSDRAR